MNADLARRALLGTARDSEGASLDAEQPVDALLAGMKIADPESLLLLRAGLNAAYVAAGYVPVSDVTAVQVAPPETLRTPNTRLVGILQQGMASDSKDLRHEMLRHMATARLHLPHELLPDVLGATEISERELLLPILGERGYWLSQFDPVWSWVQEGIGGLNDKDLNQQQKIWDEGKIADRCQVLAQWRRWNPNDAREMLARSIAQENAEHRGRLLAVMATGLTSFDEDFLEKCLDDRSTGVRQVAAELLSQLPESAFSLRMRERARAILTVKNNNPLQVICSPPESIDKSWERDGISQKPSGGRGKRAFWVESVMQAIPVSDWIQHFEASPEVLIDAVRDDSFSQSVLWGWSRACVRFASIDPASMQWANAVWAYWREYIDQSEGAARATFIEEMSSLTSVLSPENAEQRVLELLVKSSESGQPRMISPLERLPHPWSASFSDRYLQLIRFVTQNSSDDVASEWSRSLQTAARAIPPSVFVLALKSWETTTDHARAAWVLSSIEREIGRFQETVQLRQRFYEEAGA